MAKKKGFKVKTNKLPQEKFLVITNAWGLSPTGDLQPEHLNNVAAWFEIMLSDSHPGVGLKALYHQRTHRNLIVELPSQVPDISPYLGRHNYSQFLTHSPKSEQYSEVYEYRYARHGDPAEKNWMVGYPTYKKIPENIPIRRPYPAPKLASPPAIDVADYAYPVPQDIYDQRAAALLNQASTSTLTQADAQYKFAIASDAPPSAGSKVILSALPKELPRVVKKEDVDDFLAAFTRELPIAKVEDPSFDLASPTVVGDPEEDVDYVPSNELLAMLGALPPELNPLDAGQEEQQAVPDVVVKPEPIDDELPDYIPSENLLDSWASLPSGLTYVSEPEETAIEHQRDYDSSSFRAKQEPRNTVIVPSVDCEVRVKPEPVDDDYALGNYYATNLMHTSYVPPSPRVKVEIFNPEDSKAGMRIKHEESKVGIRIKPEPVDDYDSGWLLSRENVKVVPDAFKTEGEGSQLASRVSDIQIKAEAIEGSIHDKLSRGERPREYAANVKSEEKAVAPGGLVPAASHRKYEHTRAGHRPSSTSQNRHSSQRFDELPDNYARSTKRERSFFGSVDSEGIKVKRERLDDAR